MINKSKFNKYVQWDLYDGTKYRLIFGKSVAFVFSADNLVDLLAHSSFDFSVQILKADIQKYYRCNFIVTLPW